MIGEMLYHLHRHFRLVLLVGVTGAFCTCGALAYAVSRYYALK